MPAPLTPEKNNLKLGFIALLDCAPLVIAREKGFFAKYGLNAVLSRESSWASIRDKVSFGLLDGAHMLAPMPLAATLGLNGNKTPMLTSMTLSQNGTAITLSKQICDAISASLALPQTSTEPSQTAFKQYINSLDKPPVIATVYPYSNHYYQLRFWLEQQGIDLEQDINLIALPPTKMLENLNQGHIDGYCVGEPWNQLAVAKGIGGIVATGQNIWGPHMEKVLGVTQSWADTHPQTLQAMTLALQEACQWCEDAEHYQELMELLALPPYLDQTAGQLSISADTARVEQHFAGGNRNRPDTVHGLFILEQMEKSGQFSADAIDKTALINQVFRTDLYQKWLSH